MNTAKGTPDSRAGRLAQAATWLARLREPAHMSAMELRSWQHFIASPENRQAFEVMHRVASAVSAMVHPPLPSAVDLAEDQYDGSIPIRRWKQTLEHYRYGARRRGWRPASWVGIAAVAAGTLAVLGLFWSSYFGAESEQVFQTMAAEHRLVVLSDGSKIALGAKTSVDVRYTESHRVVRLTRGEALFTVVHNRERPFIVVAGIRTVVAVGTEFNIWRRLDQTTVTVTDGTVDVKPVDAVQRLAAVGTAPTKSARVSKGQRITYAESGISTTVEAADVADATAWWRGRLVYRRVPLRDVLSDVNRYFQQQFLIGDVAAGELQFSGAVLQTQSADEFVRALESIFPIEAIRVDGEHILIRSRVSTVGNDSSLKS